MYNNLYDGVFFVTDLFESSAFALFFIRFYEYILNIWSISVVKLQGMDLGAELWFPSSWIWDLFEIFWRYVL